jgi:hypothetical protein
MSNPEQEQLLSTIAALSQSMRGKNLSDIQLDLLQVAEHLMSNIAVQSAITSPGLVEIVVPEFEIGEPCQVRTVEGGPEHWQNSAWQRSTIIDKVSLNGEHEYQTAVTGRGLWVGTEALQKVDKK